MIRFLPVTFVDIFYELKPIPTPNKPYDRGYLCPTNQLTEPQIQPFLALGLKQIPDILPTRLSGAWPRKLALNQGTALL